jgi:hypothetical protein
MSNFGVKYRELSKVNLTDLISSLNAQEGMIQTQTSFLNFSYTQLANSYRNPILAIPAPQTGYFNCIVSVYASSKYGGVEYNGGFGFYYGSTGSTSAYNSNAQIAEIIQQPTNGMSYIPNIIFYGDSSPLNGAGIYIYNTTEGAVGTGTLNLYITYQTLSLS